MKIPTLTDNATRIIDKTSLTADEILDFLSNVMDSPCNYGLDGVDVADFMFDKYGNWCEEHCNNNDYKECWRKFIMARMRSGGGANDVS